MKVKRISLIIVFSSVFFVFVIVFLFLLFNRLDNDVSENSKALFGEFIQNEDLIYVAIPGDGYHLVPSADIKSFKRISDKYSDRHIGVDVNNVFCGNRIMPKMDPQKVKILGNNYYSDGKITCYCDKGTQESKKIDEWNLFNSKKTQTYFYPMVLLPSSNTPYYAILNYSLVTNGKQVFYKGKLMPKANPESIQAISLNKTERKSLFYFGDDEHLYFKNKLLSIPNSKETYSVKVELQNSEHYLHNFKTGEVYVNDAAFNVKKAPYTLLSKFDAHINHILWLSKSGIYFYNKKDKEVKNIGENPFINSGFKEIAPLIFSNGKETLYIDAYKKWNNNKSDKSLDSRYTVINRLENLDETQTWSKLGNFDTHGSVWKHGKNWYYFDNLGESQLVFNTIYKIKNEETVKKLLEKEIVINSKVIRQFIKDKKLTKPKYTTLLQAKTEYDYVGEKSTKWIFSMMLIITVIGFFLKKSAN